MVFSIWSVVRTHSIRSIRGSCSFIHNSHHSKWNPITTKARTHTYTYSLFLSAHFNDKHKQFSIIIIGHTQFALIYVLIHETKTKTKIIQFTDTHLHLTSLHLNTRSKFKIQISNKNNQALTSNKTQSCISIPTKPATTTKTNPRDVINVFVCLCTIVIRTVCTFPVGRKEIKLKWPTNQTIVRVEKVRAAHGIHAEWMPIAMRR